MNVLLTICFYEFPVANDDIIAWANKFEKYIIRKDEFEWHKEIIKIFVIKKRNDDLEFVICIKMDSGFLLDFSEIESYLEKTSTNLSLSLNRPKYLKTIIFGKVDNYILRYIIHINEKISLTYGDKNDNISRNFIV